MAKICGIVTYIISIIIPSIHIALFLSLTTRAEKPTWGSMKGFHKWKPVGNLKIDRVFTEK
jgi:hypothetical protein